MAFQERREGLPRRPPAEALHRPVVEHVVDPAHLLVRDGVERAALRQDPAHDPVAVLVRPAFPRVVRLGKVDLDAEGLFELPEERELLPVVECAGLQHALREARQHPDDRGHHAAGLLGRHAGDKREPRHALGDRDQVPRAVEPVDRVAFPVPGAGPALHARRTPVDVHAARDPAASGVPVLPGVHAARPAPLPAPRKRRQGLLRLPLPDELLPPVVLPVERLPADHRHPVAPRTPADLLRRPSEPQLLPRVLPLRVGEHPPTGGLHGDAVVGLALRLLVPVAPPALVPGQLAGDGPLVAADLPRNLRLVLSGFPQRPDYDTLVLRQTVISRRPGWDPPGFLCAHACFLVFVCHKKVYRQRLAFSTSRRNPLNLPAAKR